MVYKKKQEIIAENQVTNRFAYNSLKLTDRYHLVRDEKADSQLQKYPEKVQIELTDQIGYNPD